MALLGVALAATGLLSGMTQGALISAQVTGFVLLFLGLRGFWLPYVKASQLVVAGWIAASAFVFGVGGFALAAMLVIAAAVAVVSLTE